MSLERPLERLLYACRWLLAPLYLGLAIALIALGVKFFQEAIYAILHVFTLEEADLVLIVLALIDIVLVGSLIVMVMFSGYENFVSRIERKRRKRADPQRPCPKAVVLRCPRSLVASARVKAASPASRRCRTKPQGAPWRVA